MSDGQRRAHIGRRTKAGYDHGPERRCGELMDAADVKLRFLRFQSFAEPIKPSAIYLGKLPKFSSFVLCQRGEQK